MSVIQEVRKLNEEISDLDAIHTTVEHARTYDQRRDELASERVLLGAAVLRVVTLSAAGQVPIESLPDHREVGELLETISRKLEHEPENLTKGRDFSNLLARLGSISERLNDLVDQAWERVRAEEPPIDLDFLAQLEKIPGQEQDVERLRREISALQECGLSVPESNEAWERYVECRNRVQDCLEALAVDRFPEEVREFFKYAHGHLGAPLKLLTEGVKKWLADNNLLDRIRVKVGPSQ